jgi:hypothetical protein
VLLAFAIEFEKQSEVSLAICANVLRLADDDGVAVRDLPRLSGVSKEAIAMAVSFLGKRGYAKLRERRLVLNATGRDAREMYHQLAERIEQRWKAPALRKWLEAFLRRSVG